MIDNSKIPKQAIDLIKKLKEEGFSAYIVGGSIRDLLLGIYPEEWDVATSATPEVVSSLFHKVIPTGIKFGTVMVVFEEKTFEVTTFRKDEKYFDGRHPENVKFTKDLHEDLKRRDFTINSMAYDPTTEEFVDLFFGTKDLDDSLIRAVGDPIERFSEDGLRSIRACRFSSQLEFEIEEKTFAAISKELLVSQKVAIERVHDEIVKILKTRRPSIAFENMRKSGLLEIFIPELVSLYGVDQPKEYHKYDVYWHSLYSCDFSPRDNLAVRLAALLHDIAKPVCRDGETFYNHDKKGEELVVKILKRLKFSNEIIEKTSNLVSHHMFNYSSEWSDSAVRRFIKRVGTQNLEDLFLLRVADVSGMGMSRSFEYLDELRQRIDKILKEEDAINVSDLKINGKDVMEALNLDPGPKVGEVLSEILEKVLDDPKLNSREKLMEILNDYKN